MGRELVEIDGRPAGREIHGLRGGREFITERPNGQDFFENNEGEGGDGLGGIRELCRRLAFRGRASIDHPVPLDFPVFLPDAAATLGLGREIGRVAEAGEVIALVGDLGAGKTTLTQGIVEGLGYREEITSPTFTLVQEYAGGRLEVFHFDFYRVEQEHELLELGWDDYLERGGLVIVEWPDLHPELLPKETFWLELSHREDGRLVGERRP